MKLAKHSMLAAALCAAAAGAPAQAGCWNDTEMAAARVRQLQTTLMVATLKCRAAGIDITPAYNGFVKARLDAINAANGAIKQHFAAAGGQVQYDRFTTTLANGYSADGTDAAACARAAQLAADAADGSVDLTRISEQRVADRALPEGACAAPVLAATPAPQPAAEPQLIAAVAPAAAPAAEAALPPEVAAAMAVIAAYARHHGAMLGSVPGGWAAAPAVQTAAAP